MRSVVQAVFQDPSDSLNPVKRVRDILSEPIRNLTTMSRREAEDRIRESIELVGLSATSLEVYPSELTGANQQRVAVARALVTRPRLIILDEPTSRLDVAVRGLLLRLLSDLQNDLGIAYLFISHDLTAVRQLSDRIAVLYLGEIVEHGTTAAIFDNPCHPYTQALLAAVLYPDPKRPPGGVELLGEIPSPTAIPNACALAPRCPFAKQLCWDEPPPMRNVGHTISRCHFADQFVRDRAQSEPIETQPKVREASAYREKGLL
jgi:oligopeptide/dipeptide ABC transporter ATP-binding protein